ncbi:uncharacterized protein STEHIDRAFT_46076 [Stereum hirsutum FP-91666 SS1]|uniref:uncharacterized protein n=1 Tax=Stereum hirsutum (strain FP-91666) TaxID=721885 RepID=UPI000440C4E0|nr:uncharacterized protein STEHIDRAFT_46076 [Stereum hirsutum FP-91666 SS1]EIM91774.1 hypothetical protein STEHIDRAFT_46076 [Stereum hirsutum FP-91666 SS1]
MSVESPIDLPLERSLYVGNFMRGILYGIELFTFSQAAHRTLSQPAQSNRRSQVLYVVYGAVLMTMVTIAVTTDALWGEFMWIDHRNHPGGPLGYFGATTSMWMNVFGSAADATANILGDGLLLYRCYMIWGSKLWIIAFPTLIYLASSVLVIITIVESALPGAFLLNGAAANFGVPWVSLSVSLNVILTAMICGRLLMMRRMTLSMMTPEMGNMYTGVMSILVESALPFSVVGLGFVVTYAKSSPTSNAFAYVWGMFCSLSPQMIIWRVAMGRGWSKETVQQVSGQMVFAHPESTTEIGGIENSLGTATLNASDSNRSLKEPKSVGAIV